MTDKEFDIDETEMICKFRTPSVWKFDDVFVRHARTALPAACKKIRELQAEIERLRSER